MVVSRSTLVIALSAALMACQAKESAVQEGAAATVAPQDEAPTGSAAPEKPAWTLRPTSQIQAEGNHLKGEGSVYLTQHAFNPLEWYPWGEEALERAIKEDKPIFLSIGYASCHWCHVMEHEVFEKEDVAAYMNEHFVNIKVDREERPDLDAIYMTAVQRLTGGGGWPMTVLLTPSLKPFFGGTYFPKRRFMAIAKDAVDRFKNQRNDVESEGDRLHAQISEIPDARPGGRIGEASLQRIISRAKGAFDAKWGGLQGRRKFPTPARWRYLVHAYRKWGDEGLAEGVRRTLDRMADGGIFDQVGGGFYRYTVEPTWLIPHFEKMLYDNGQLASLYIEAAAAFAEPRYLNVAREVLDFMLKEMHEPAGGFYASYDADSGGEEGTFYVWTPKELRAIAGESDGEVLALLLGVTEGGNFEHKTSVVTRRISMGEVGKRTGRTAKAVEAIWAKYRPILYDVRAKRIWPGLDKKLVTAWNGLAIGAMAKGFAATGDVRYRDAAQKTADLLWERHRRPGGGLYRASNQGKAEHLAILDDYGFLAVGLLDLFEATGELRHLERAKTLLEEADQRFAREEGAWFLTEVVDETLIARTFDPYDSVRPSGNSSLLEANLRYSAITGSTQRHKLVETTLGAYASMVSRGGLGTAGWATVALMLGGPFYDVVFAGDPNAEDLKSLKAEYVALSPSWGVRTTVTAAGPSPEQLKAMPPLMAKTARDGASRAYVCVRGTCKKPTGDPRELRAQVLDGWTR